MATKPDPEDHTEARYEYRVWGKHKRARKLLAKLADEAVSETVDDCYFLVDGQRVNAKVRNKTLKVKHLVEKTKGFERWAATRYRSVKDAPAPFDELFEDLRRDRERRGSSFDLSKAVARLDAEVAATVLLVSKSRQRYRIGDMKAEVTDITVQESGEVLRTLAIEGDDLDELIALRKRLGLKGTENVAVHVAIDALS